MTHYSLSSLKARPTSDLVVVPVWAQVKHPKIAADDDAFDELVSFPFKKGDFLGEPKELLLLYGKGRVLLVGLGKEEECTLETVRSAYGAALKRIGSTQAKSASFLMPSTKKLGQSELVTAALEGVMLAGYSFEQFKKQEGASRLEKICFCGASDTALLKRVETLIDAVHLTRDLVNGNADEVNVDRLKKVAKEMGPSVKVQILEKAALEKEKMGLMLAVGRAAAKDPALILLEYKGNSRSKETIAVVGKGITFDTGGLNIKVSGSSMESMKCDMAGAAVVLGVIKAAAALKLKVNLIGVLAVAENAIGPLSYKPGDVFRSRSGKTVEITNTDAEGRLVLADAISYVEEKFAPTTLVDFATLTGGVVVALGEESAGLFSTDDALAAALMDAGNRTYERVWRLPLYPEYKEDLKSKIADMKNSGSRKASAGQGATFIKEFVTTKRWAHLDIAGTAYLSETRTYHPTLATGMGVRLFIDFLEHLHG